MSSTAPDAASSSIEGYAPPGSLTPFEVLRRYPEHRASLPSLLASRTSVRPDHPFLVFEGSTLSYAAFGALAAGIADGLAARGIGAGDRVGLLAANHPSIAACWFALARLGAIMVPVNPEFGLDEAGYILGHAGVSGIVCSHEAREKADAIALRMRTEGAPQPWVLVNESDEWVRTIAPRGSLGHVKPLDDATLADRTAVLIYTSGTTGLPKGVMHSQRNAVLTGEAFVERVDVQPDERLLCILPLFHMNALFYSLCGALAAGATVVLADRFSASGFWPLVARTGATLVNTIAAVSSILTERPRSEYIPGHALRKMYGAPLSPRICQLFADEFAVPIAIEGYGMSEIPGVLSNPVRGLRKLGSMGLPARHPDHTMRFAQMRVVDADGNEVRVDEVGELVVRTPILMQGYYRDPAQTAAAFRDDWFLTGDLGYRDADGYFWFVARKKDIIRRRGENIAGAELDRVIGEHPDVLEAAAIGVPSALGEDDILVAVVLKAGAAPDAASIARWCAQRLAAYKQPRYIAFVSALPHTATHRVAKYKLREIEGLQASAIDLQQTQ